MSEHTPGPWEVIDHEEGPYVVAFDPVHQQIGPIVCEDIRGRANARLIAAAPELLAACKALRDAFLMGPDMTRIIRMNEATDQAEAAIAAAEGRAGPGAEGEGER